MRKNESTGKPRGKSSFNPADSIVKDTAARIGTQGKGPGVPVIPNKARPSYPPQFSKQAGGQGENVISRNLQRNAIRKGNL